MIPPIMTPAIGAVLVTIPYPIIAFVGLRPKIILIYSVDQNFE